jgi:signal transduction histidine kinase
LKTALRSIKGYIDYILDGSAGEVPEDMRDFLDVVERNTGRLQNLTEDLLDHQRLSSGETKLEEDQLELEPFVREVIDELKPMLEEKDQVLELSIPEDINELRADREKIGQVLLNLLSNASNYSPEGSCIILEIEEKNNRVKVKVSDEGIGLSDEDKEKLFEPFIHIDTPEEYSSGTGLGLSICRGIVEMHGGEIWAESEGRGKGSTFIFALPKGEE